MLLGLWLHTHDPSHHSLPLSLTCFLLPSKRPRRVLHSSGPFMAVSPSQGPYGHLLVCTGLLHFQESLSSDLLQEDFKRPIEDGWEAQNFL